MDSAILPYSTIGDGVTFSSGGRVSVGANCLNCQKPEQFKGEVTYVNLWDKALSEASVQNLALSCGVLTGNVLQWSFFAAMVEGEVQYVPISACKSEGEAVNSALG